MSILLRLGGAAEASTPRVMDCGVSRKPRHQTQTWIHSIILPILASTLVASMPFTQAQASIGPQAEPPTYRHASSIRLPAAPVETKPPQALDWRVPAIPFVSPAPVSGLNLPLLSFVPPVERPFVQTEWPLPQPAPPFKSLEYPRLPAAPVESQPFKQLAWPVSPIPFEPPAPTGSLNLPLYSFVQVDRPFVQTDWPLPVQPPRHRAVQSFRLPSEAPAIARPFTQLNWPNAKLVPPFRHPQIGQEFSVIYKPLAQTEWPLPAFPPRYDHPVTDQAVPVFAREVIVVPRPFVQTEWTVSLIPFEQPAQVYGTTLPLFTAVVQDKPFTQLDWPLPRIPRIGHTPSDGIPSFFRSLVDRPFSQTDWPVPTGPIEFRHVSTDHSVPVFYRSVLERPFAQYDWPLPDRVVVTTETSTQWAMWKQEQLVSGEPLVIVDAEGRPLTHEAAERAYRQGADVRCYAYDAETKTMKFVASTRPYRMDGRA